MFYVALAYCSDSKVMVVTKLGAVIGHYRAEVSLIGLMEVGKILESLRDKKTAPAPFYTTSAADPCNTFSQKIK